MIVVSNTMELEQRYDLNRISDDEMITIWGGLEGKEKYNKQYYKDRVTYKARDVKAIIETMKSIEDYIPEKWDKWQRVKYIYTVLGNNISYGSEEERPGSQQASNLSILLSRKGICAGYSLLFKEMMDRQSIPCDYVRGRVEDNSGKSAKHAWNVLQIGENIFPVDLTWDSSRMRAGYKQFCFLGNDENFQETHFRDTDERKYRFTFIPSKFIENININKPATKNSSREIKDDNREKKLLIVEKAITETYKKFSRVMGTEMARKQVELAIKDYLQKGKPEVFTRENSARDGIIKYVSQEDMIDVIVEQYVRNAKLPRQKQSNVLTLAIKETFIKYRR